MRDETCLGTLSTCLRAIAKAQGRADEQLWADALNAEPPSRESVDRLAGSFGLDPEDVDDVLRVLALALPDPEESAVEDKWVGPFLLSAKQQAWIARTSRLVGLTVAKEMTERLAGRTDALGEVPSSEALRRMAEAAGASWRQVEDLRRSLTEQVAEAVREAAVPVVADTETAIVDAVLLKMAPLLLEKNW